MTFREAEIGKIFGVYDAKSSRRTLVKISLTEALDLETGEKETFHHRRNIDEPVIRDGTLAHDKHGLPIIVKKSDATHYVINYVMVYKMRIVEAEEIIFPEPPELSGREKQEVYIMIQRASREHAKLGRLLEAVADMVEEE